MSNVKMRPQWLPQWLQWLNGSALELMPGDEHGRMLAQLQRRLMQRRVAEGIHAGTWNPEGRWSPVGGRLHSTTMATLCLQARGPAAGG